MRIRRFVVGRDDADWVKVRNAVYYQHPTAELITMEDFRKLQKDPEWDPNGRFIADVNGLPVGLVHAHVDKLREEKKGFVWVFGLVPEFRGQGIEEELAKTAIKELTERGMKAVQSAVGEDRREDALVWTNLGFKLVRTGSVMTRMLDETKPGVGENMEVVLEPLRADSDADLELLNQLSNESFKEHFNFRPTPLESTVYLVREDFTWRPQEWFFALLDRKRVGFIGVAAGPLDNRPENRKRGWFLPRGWVVSIGVLKPYRRKGIGTRLILRGMDSLKAMGMAAVMLGVDNSNVTKAKQLYEKVGFTEVWKVSVYEKEIA